jgi:hypothetical protein
MSLPRLEAKSGVCINNMTSVIPVNLESQFRACLDLRCVVYKSLGYLSSDAVIDLDRFDCSSLHYAAVDESQAVVGTARLILPRACGIAIQRDLDRVEQWCLHVRDQYRIVIDRLSSLPVLETLEYNKRPISILGSKRPAELSRMIVAPQSRGQHIARALADVVVSEAKLLRRDVLFLECVANDVSHYKKYEFEPIVSALVYPHLIVKDEVVTMSRRL